MRLPQCYIPTLHKRRLQKQIYKYKYINILYGLGPIHKHKFCLALMLVFNTRRIDMKI